jgi:hypothetical protein
MEAQPGSLAVFRTAQITQFFPSRLLEPFDAYSVEVREHREHSNMELLETKSRIDVTKTGRPESGLFVEAQITLFIHGRHGRKAEVLTNMHQATHARQRHGDSRS